MPNIPTIFFLIFVISNLLKKCTLCGVVQTINNFQIVDKRGSRRGQCKNCRRIYNQEYRKKHRVQISEQRRRYRDKNEIHLRAKSKNYRYEHKEQIRKSKKRNYEAYKKTIYEYNKKNVEKIRERRRNYQKKRRLEDNNYRISCNLRSRLGKLMRGEKQGSAVQDLGCNLDEFIEYLESKFYLHPKTGEQMGWDNYGQFGWHIDHIVPLCLFDLTRRDHVIFACHYSNLQPMWAYENLSKNGKVI